MPQQWPFFFFFFWKLKTWYLTLPWQMTLTLVLKKRLHPKEYTCEIWKLYHLPFKSYGQCKTLCVQTNEQTDWRTNRWAKNYLPPIYQCGGIKVLFSISSISWSSIKGQSKLLSFYLYSYFNSFPNKPWFLLVCSTSLLKTLLEKEKLLVKSNFSLSQSVFYLFG